MFLVHAHPQETNCKLINLLIYWNPQTRFGVVHILRNHFPNSRTEFCGRRAPQLVVARGHNIFEVTGTPIRGQRPPQFLVPEGHEILEVTDDYVIKECSLLAIRMCLKPNVDNISSTTVSLVSLDDAKGIKMNSYIILS